MILLITGGAACGKSAHAERFCMAKGSKKLYLATMRPFGEAARSRIERHRKLRECKGFETLERETHLEALSFPNTYDTILLEDIGNLVANEMFANSAEPEDDTALAARIASGVLELLTNTQMLALVTNEVFSDSVVYSPETEHYRRLLGEVNTRIAQKADVVFESVCGILVPLKGG